MLVLRRSAATVPVLICMLPPQKKIMDLCQWYYPDTNVQIKIKRSSISYQRDKYRLSQILTNDRAVLFLVFVTYVAQYESRMACLPVNTPLSAIFFSGWGTAPFVVPKEAGAWTLCENQKWKEQEKLSRTAKFEVCNIGI